MITGLQGENYLCLGILDAAITVTAILLDCLTSPLSSLRPRQLLRSRHTPHKHPQGRHNPHQITPHRTR